MIAESKKKWWRVEQEEGKANAGTELATLSSVVPSEELSRMCFRIDQLGIKRNIYP